MKNKFKYFLLIFFLINSFAIANSEEIKFDDIRFEASKIEYLNQENTIKASGEVRIFLDETTEIFADKFTYYRPKYLLIIEDNVPCIKDDLPLPETPVTQTIQPRGIEQLTSDKLFPLAPIKLIILPLPSLLNEGTGTSNSLLRNLDVRDF